MIRRENVSDVREEARSASDFLWEIFFHGENGVSIESWRLNERSGGRRRQRARRLNKIVRVAKEGAPILVDG